MPAQELSKSKALLQGGGPANGEDPMDPFLLFSALLDLGEDLCGFASTLHGGLFAVLMDEVMGTAANFQAREFLSLLILLRAMPPSNIFYTDRRILHRTWSVHCSVHHKVPQAGEDAAGGARQGPRRQEGRPQDFRQGHDRR